MMKISKLPDKKEWDRIVDEAFTSNEEHRFSQRYVSHKNEMLGGINMKRRTVNNKSKNNSRKLMLSVGAVAAAFVLVPTGAFLASNSGGASAPGTEIDDPSETTVTEEATENKTEDTISLDINGFKLDMEKVKLFNIGDTFINDFKKEHGEQCCDITVKSARIQDNFDGVKTDCDGNEKDYSEWIDENGRLKPNTRSWYSEEELYAMSEAVATEEMQMRVVVIELTYTNNNDSELIQVVAPYMFVYKDGNANTADFQPMKDGASSVQNSLGIVTTYGGMFSYDSDKKAKSNLLSLGAGEGADVQVAFLINAGDVGALLFSADPLGSNVKSRDYYDCPIVDLREIS